MGAAVRHVTLTTVLPLLEIELELPREKDKEVLGNDYFIALQSSVSGLTIVNDEYMRHELSERAWSLIGTTDLYLGVSKKFPDNSALQGGSAACNEQLDRFLLALNLNEKLWTFSPDVRFSWVEKDEPRNRQFFNVRHASPISTFDNKPMLRDFFEAAQLTIKIDAIYEEESDERYPAIKTAFGALRLSTYAFNTSIRFLQLAIALEALCSTGTTEVRHRVATVCAILTANSAQERKELYQKTKQLYDVRSRIIHGSGKRATKSELQDMERLTCKLLRRVLDDDILQNYRTRSLQSEFLIQVSLERTVPAS